MSIRPAVPGDIPVIVELGEQLHRASSYAVRRFDPEKVAALMRNLIDGAGVVFVAERAGHVVGGIAGAVTADWFGPDLHGFDFSFFVRPDARHGITAMRLLTAFECWARIKGATVMRIGITTGIGAEGTARLYRALGYRDNGALFIKEISNGD